MPPTNDVQEMIAEAKRAHDDALVNPPLETGRHDHDPMNNDRCLAQWLKEAAARNCCKGDVTARALLAAMDKGNERFSKWRIHKNDSPELRQDMWQEVIDAMYRAVFPEDKT